MLLTLGYFLFPRTFTAAGLKLNCLETLQVVPPFMRKYENKFPSNHTHGEVQTENRSTRRPTSYTKHVAQLLEYILLSRISWCPKPFTFLEKKLSDRSISLFCGCVRRFLAVLNCRRHLEKIITDVQNVYLAQEKFLTLFVETLYRSYTEPQQGFQNNMKALTAFSRQKYFNCS